MLWFTGLNGIANVVWNETWSDPRAPHFITGDVLYLVDYSLLSGAFVLMYRAAGGSLRGSSFWRDMLTVVVALFAALWAFLFAPYLPSGATHALNVATTATYAVVLTLMMAMSALLFAQTEGLRERVAPLLLVGAALCEAAWEIAWLAGQLTGRSYVGLLYNFGDVLCFSLVAAAAAAQMRSLRSPEAGRRAESVAYGFVPILSVLVAVALVAGSAITAHGVEAWIRVALVICGVFLLVVRQRSARHELKAAYQALAVQVSDARVTELVRQSDELLLVTDQSLVLTFVSPAAVAILGTSPDELRGRPAEEVLGQSHAARLHKFLQALGGGGSATSEMEVTITGTDGRERLLRIAANDQTSNPVIAGTVLAISDVTKQRALEGEVVDAVTRERAHFSERIHDGLGQELSGIALMLHSAATNPNTDARAQRDALQTIVGHVNRTIAAARRLAEDLSPLHVARNSLLAALLRLVQELRLHTQVRLDCAVPDSEPTIGASVADHVYRIAREAIGRAMRHEGCTAVQVVLAASPDGLMLTVTGNHSSMGATELAVALNLSLMEYRARIIGGRLRLERVSGCVTRMVLQAPLLRAAVAG